MKKTILALSVFTLLITACNKDEDTPANVTPTVSNLTGTYIITAASITSGGTSVNVFNNTNESMNYFEACDRDDQYKLNADMSFNVVDAGTACSPDNNYSGTWALPSSTTIDIDGTVSTIKSFNGKTLVATEDYGGATYSVTYQKL